MVGSIERVPGGARCPSPSALGAGVSAIAAAPPPPSPPPPLSPPPLLPPPPPPAPGYRHDSGWRRRCHSCARGAGAAGARGSGREGVGPRGTQQVEPGVPGCAPPAHHAALCHLSRPQAKILSMMEDNKQLALRIDGAVQSASQEVTNLRAELTATNRRLAELSGGSGPGPGPGPGAAASASAAADSAVANMENHQHSAQGRDRPAPRAEERQVSRTGAWRGPEARRPPSLGRNRLALWLVTLSVWLWPPLPSCWELQAAVLKEDPGAVCTGSHGHTGPGRRERGAAGGPLSAAESAL